MFAKNTDIIAKKLSELDEEPNPTNQRTSHSNAKFIDTLSKK